MRHFLAVLLWLGVATVDARAQDVSRPHACVATLLNTGQPVNVRERIGASGFMALASFDPDGWPVITYAPAYFKLPPTVQAFLALHECGHLVRHTTDEFEANCYALEVGGWSREEIATIELSHRSLGRLPPQYGGSGAAFWAGTKRTCPQLFGNIVAQAGPEER